MEKLIENSSFFRTSREERFALDIMRAVLQTAVAARARLQRRGSDTAPASIAYGCRMRFTEAFSKVDSAATEQQAAS